MLDSAKKKISVICLIAAVVIGGFLLVRFVRYSEKPNILFITMDALRPDYMGCYGYKRNTTPNIDKFAKDAVIFTQAVSVSCHTAPSNASLVSSVYPNVHHVSNWKIALSSDLPVLPQILQKHGYKTAFFSNQLGFCWMDGFNRGFDTFNLLMSKMWNTGRKVADITDSAIGWLRRNKNKRFFLWVYYLDPHGPYNPSVPYDKLFVNDGKLVPDKTLPICKDLHSQKGCNCIPYYLKRGNIRSVNFYISQYCGEIREDDDCVGRLLKELKRLRLDKDTIIVINSDHGEAMGEHNQYFSHALFLYDESIRIPLIFRYSRLKTCVNKLTPQVSIIDITPTILDLLRIKIPSSMQGVSLKPIILGSSRYFREFSFGEWLDKIYIRSKRWKLIYNGENDSYELYNLAKDPQETHNLVNKEVREFGFLKDKIAHYRNIPIGRTVMGKKTKSVENEKSILRSLGYAQ